MQEELIFSKIVNNTIFVDDYTKFEKNNVVTFSNSGIVVLYGPNGTGKTSLVKVLSGEKGTKVSYNYNGSDYTDDSQFFVINDQNNRNIISGSHKDFLLGDNIRREFELQEYIKIEYLRLCTEEISMLKRTYMISSSSSKAIECFTNETQIYSLVKDLMNNRSKGNKVGIDGYISAMELYKNIVVGEFEEEKLNFLIAELSEKDSLIEEIESLEVTKMTANAQIKEIEENTEALRILNHFHYKKQCIVCDTEDIDIDQLLQKKTKNRETIIEKLDEKTKGIIEKIIAKVDDEDLFQIKERLLQAIETGALEEVQVLKDEINLYRQFYAKKAIFDMFQIYDGSDIKRVNDEYKMMISEKPEIAEEDFLYIEEIISNSMNKKLQLIRDDNKNIKIVLDSEDFIGVERNGLPLSTGEQNFLSLTFEFLKAKNSDKPIVVLDDPISSFDSIYKNKIAYAIIKMLENKKRIILTHNVDLLRLLDGQYKKCFKLLLFNNTDNEENGFIPLNYKEQDMLINLEKLLDTFRNDIYPYIKEKEYFLVSMIPFMRGYAGLVDNGEVKENLTQVMHGYKNQKVNISKIYVDLFGNKEGKLPKDVEGIISGDFEVNVDDILNMDINGKEIVDKSKYPLLNRTLVHSFTYLFLRLMIEKKLVEKYKIDTSRYTQLGQIISQAFPDNADKTAIKNRVMLTSKKTLLNEFNHFEGNMSIFQPAIDITDHMLEKERTDILEFVNNL